MASELVFTTLIERMFELNQNRFANEKNGGCHGRAFSLGVNPVTLTILEDCGLLLLEI